MTTELLSGSELNLVTLADYPHLLKENECFIRLWPEFMFYDRYELQLGGYTPFSQKFSSFQLYLQTSAGKPIAMISTAPCHWNGSLADLPTGWSDMKVRAWNNRQAEIETNTLALYEMMILPEHRGKGIAKQLLQALRRYAEQNKFQAIIVPVRPSLKHLYPLIPIERYAYWKCPDGVRLSIHF